MTPFVYRISPKHEIRNSKQMPELPKCEILEIRGKLAHLNLLTQQTSINLEFYAMSYILFP